VINQFVYFEAPGEPSLYARVTEIRGKTAVLKTLKDYGHLKNAVWGVTTRNREQNFAMNLLMDPEVDFVTLTGTAGTGKTLMALAAGLTQVLDDRRYTEIIMTRATVSVGEDIGFLPGTEEEKMGPWMGALDDNLELLGKTDGGAGEWGRAATNELIRSRIKIKSMNFMRGRTFLNKYVIIDEAQNLTPKQMKTLITRAGPGTKIICMGNLAQIDTPYLTEGSSGLTFAVDKFKGWPHSGHITLARGERSRLADFASEVLYAISWFEIPVADLDRAQTFYETVLARKLRRETSAVTAGRVSLRAARSGGALQANASATARAGSSIRIYLDCARSIDAVLARIEAAGGQIVAAKSALPPGMGFIAHMRDTEGNEVGLHALD
jgi:predicted enzyme related to lactoylglutathione lyase